MEGTVCQQMVQPCDVPIDGVDVRVVAIEVGGEVAVATVEVAVETVFPDHSVEVWGFAEQVFG